MIFQQIKRHEEPVAQVYTYTTGVTQSPWDAIRNMPDADFKALLAKGRSLYKPGDVVALKTSNQRSMVKIMGFEEDKTKLLNYHGKACFIYAHSIAHGNPNTVILYCLEELDWDTLEPVKEEEVSNNGPKLVLDLSQRKNIKIKK